MAFACEDVDTGDSAHEGDRLVHVYFPLSGAGVPHHEGVEPELVYFPLSGVPHQLGFMFDKKNKFYMNISNDNSQPKDPILIERQDKHKLLNLNRLRSKDQDLFEGSTVFERSLLSFEQ